MLRESKQVVILQYAIDAVKGTELEDWQQEDLDDLLSDPEAKEAYEKDIKDLKEYRDEVGEEQFRNTTFDVPYSYGDDDDEDYEP